MKKKKNEHWEVEIEVCSDGIRWLRLPVNFKSESKAAVVRKYHELIQRVNDDDMRSEIIEQIVNEKPDYMGTIESTRFAIKGGVESKRNSSVIDRDDFAYDLRVNLLYYPFNLKYEF